MRQKILSFVLCLCLLLGVMADIYPAKAATVATGTVHVDDSLRVRSGPGTSYSVAGWLYNGDVVTILETVTSGGSKWYKITKDALSGYASADYITVNASYETDEEFEAYLTAQGFPESYKTKLRQLHTAYPKWIFKAQPLTMSWETALEAESRVGKNTIQSPDAWKSMEYGAYNWNTNSYVAFDSGGWVSAARSVIAYYMDPRNWLDDTYIFQFEELSFSEDQTLEGIKAILPATLDKHAEDLLKAARESQVSAYFLASKIVQEGTAINGLGTGTVPGYEGYYNFFDIGAYAHDGRSAVENGAIYAKTMGWTTPYKCMLDSANSIGRSYIKLGQNTTYFQKFNVVNTQSGLYGHQYMSNVAGAASEGSIRRRNTAEAQLRSALIFVIPVYQKLPETISPRPGTTGNNNNFLDSLTVAGYTLTPSFDRYTANYAVQVDGNVNTVNVSAVLNNQQGKISGAGQITLKPGENVVTLTATATSGATRTYTITITREGGSATLPTITGKTYAVGTTVTRVEPETTVTDFIKALAVTNGSAGVYTSAGTPKTSGLVATGDILRLLSGTTVTASYPIVIYGDVNGDGRVTSLDLRIAQKHILGTTPLNGYALTAADASRDANVTSLDLRQIQKYILGLTSSLQK